MQPSEIESVLQSLRERAGTRQTQGLRLDQVMRFADDPALGTALKEAAERRDALSPAWDKAFAKDETDLRHWLQSDLLNFYPEDAVNPYVPLAARGPWLVTTHGAILHDSGGYGMLGFGHSPQPIVDILSKPWVIANVMTPSLSQKRFSYKLRDEIGHTREDHCPYRRFVCMNSGSEANEVALRISDIHAALLTAPGARYEGRQPRVLAIAGGFHGRTSAAAFASDSSLPSYRKWLYHFDLRDRLDIVAPYDTEALRTVFQKAEQNGYFYEIMLFEPVMGEGNPGQAMPRAFYDEARRLTREADTLLLADSVQAGLRAHGVLSIVDYPGFSDAEAPDMESYSKAINAAQYPLSVLALSSAAAATYRKGVYGNTMTTNPRAIETAMAVLDLVTPELRENITTRGREFLTKLAQLAQSLPEGVITRVEGTGLLLSAHLAPELEVLGHGGIEERCRMQGVGLIHGGRNALRFTPHFAITSREIDLILEVVRDVLLQAAPKL